MQDELWTSSDEQRLDQLYWEKSGKLQPVGPYCEWPSPLSNVPNIDWAAMFARERWALAA